MTTTMYKILNSIKKRNAKVRKQRKSKSGCRTGRKTSRPVYTKIR